MAADDDTKKTSGDAAATVASLLRNVGIFAGLDEAALAALAAGCRRRAFGAGETLFHEGDPGHALYLIVSGRINIQRTTQSGETVHIAQRGRGQPVGEMSLLDGLPRSGDAVTETPCELLLLDRAEFVRCVERSPRIALNVLACLAGRLREAADAQRARQQNDVLGRLCAFLSETPNAADGNAPARLTQQQIAERIGATRESVNRALGRLVQAGAIRRENRSIRVADREKLQRYRAG